jgi:hypothetical protein
MSPYISLLNIFIILITIKIFFSVFLLSSLEGVILPTYLSLELSYRMSAVGAVAFSAIFDMA